MRRVTLIAIAMVLVAALLLAPSASADGPKEKVVTKDVALPPGSDFRFVHCNQGDGEWLAVEGSVARLIPNLIILDSSPASQGDDAWYIRYNNSSGHEVEVTVSVRCMRPPQRRGQEPQIDNVKASTRLTSDHQKVLMRLICRQGYVAMGLGFSMDKLGPSTAPPPGQPFVYWRGINEQGHTDTVRIENQGNNKFDFTLHLRCLNAATKVAGKPATLRTTNVPGSITLDPGGSTMTFAPSCPVGDVPTKTEYEPVSGALYTYPSAQTPLTLRTDPLQIFNLTSSKKTVNAEVDCITYELR